MKNLNQPIIIFFILLAQFSFSQTILFEEDFGTSHSSSYMYTNWCSSSPTDNSYGTDCTDGLNWWVYGSGKYAKSNDISIPATGTTELTFEYKFNKFGSYPTVEIANGCYSTYASVKILDYQGSCTSETIDLSSYAGQTVNIGFFTHHSDGTFILDNVVVTNTVGGSGGGSSCPFEDYFTSSSVNTSNWTSTLGMYTTSSISCDGGDYAAYLSTSSYSNYAQTSTIDLTSVNSAELTFNYYMSSSAYDFQCADLSISTDGGSNFTNLNLPYEDPDGTCKSMTFDLSSYIGNQIILKFNISTTSYTFYWDEFKVCTSSGGPDLKWADDFNDNNLNLDYAGNDGDEQYSGQSWNIGIASIEPEPYNQTVNYNKSEAFAASESQDYSIQIDKEEYFESPTVDLSTQEAFKISFYVDKYGGTSSDWIGSHVYLKIWDGSTWVQVLSLGGSSSDDQRLLESGFGYHCITIYKSSTSPGDYYPNLAVNPSLFTSSFKFKIELQGYGGVSAYVDNITFRADDDGEVVIPCGISYWNSTDATHYGRDPEGTSSNNAVRGVEVEIDDPFGVGIPPDWVGHCNDGNIGSMSSGYYTIWSVISEQEITNNTYTKLYYTNGSDNQNPNMSQDNSYSGPGFLYYYKLYTGCNGEAGAYDPQGSLDYSFWFDFGNNMPNTYYQLNSSGIETGGGVTSSDEYLAPGITCGTLPIELIKFEGEGHNQQNVLSWSTASEINNSHFEIERSVDGINFEYIGQIEGAGNSNQIQNYNFMDRNPLKGQIFYRLKQIDFDENSTYSKIVQIQNKESIDLSMAIKDKNLLIKFGQTFTGEIKIYNIEGQEIENKKMNQTLNTIIPIHKKGMYIAHFRNHQFTKTQRFIIQ